MNKKKVFHKFTTNTQTNNNYDFTTAYDAMLKRAVNDDDILKIYETFIKKSTSKQFSLKLTSLETFSQNLFSSKTKNILNFKNRNLYYYANDILIILIKRLDCDYRIELLIYDFIQKYGKFLTALKLSRTGYSPFNTLCWTSRKLPFSIFNNVATMLHNLGYDIFLENKMGETCIEALINKLRSDNKFSVEVFTQRYFSLINLTDRQIVNTLKFSITHLIVELSLDEAIQDSMIIKKYLDRLTFCVTKNFYLCYTTLIYRLAALRNEGKHDQVDDIKKILVLLNNRSLQDYKNDTKLEELYLYLVSLNKTTTLNFTELITTI